MDLNEIAYSRNKLMSGLLLIAILLGAVAALLSGLGKEVIIMGVGVGGIITAIIAFFTFKRILEYYVRFFVAIGVSLVAFLIMQGSPVITSYFYVFFILILITLYNDYKPIILSGVMAVGLTFHAFYYHSATMFPGLEMKDAIRFSFYILLTTILLSAQSRIVQNLLKHVTEEKQHALTAKNHVENLLSKLKTSITGLGSFSSNLSRNIKHNSKVTAEINTAFGEIAMGVEAQAGSVNEINSSMKDIQQKVDESNQSSLKMSEIANNISDTSQKGNQTMNILKEESKKSNQTISTSIGFIKELNNQSTKIGKILDVIHDISEQTNLLSLNASIEAARAGEHGRGFSVVADEIRKLAMTSRESIDQISSILQDISNKSNEAYKEMANSEKVIKSNEDAVEGTISLFSEITHYSSQVLDQANNIEQDMLHLQNYAKTFVSEISSIANISEEHAASIEEVLASTEEQKNRFADIANGYRELEQLISELKSLSEDKII